MAEEQEYILGTDRAEIERLRFQHLAWVREAFALWERAGIRSGYKVIDLGCGPGFTSLELAHIVGPKGKVIARDRSARFLEFLRSERDRLSQMHVEPSLGLAEELDLPRDRLDAAYARWLLCWVEDPAVVLERLAHSVKRDGIIAFQEYLDWGAMKLIPQSEIFSTVIEACMKSWKKGGATINIGEHIPSLAAECGLQVEYISPLARIGRVGSMKWAWLTQFFRSYLPKLVEQGLLEADRYDAYLRDWDGRAEEGKSYCQTPTMVDVILRKP